MDVRFFPSYYLLSFLIALPVTRVLSCKSGAHLSALSTLSHSSCAQLPGGTAVANERCLVPQKLAAVDNRGFVGLSDLGARGRLAGSTRQSATPLALGLPLGRPLGAARQASVCSCLVLPPPLLLLLPLPLRWLRQGGLGGRLVAGAGFRWDVTDWR